MSISSGSWDSEDDIATGTGFDSNFDACLTEENILAVTYENGQLLYREYDGWQWSGVFTVDSSGGSFPQVQMISNMPYIIYLSAFGSNQNQILFNRKESGGFTSPALLDNSKKVWDRVLCFDASAADYDDLTTAAANDTTGDIKHSDSGALVKTIGDVLYLGLSTKFHYAKFILSTAGVNGAVNWEYFNGSDWQTFTPSSGIWHMTSLDKEMLLWNDIDSIPDTWQKTTVNGESLFWVRARVIADYTTAPIGSQITAVADTRAIVLME
jgi:hypothetical protein